MTHGCCSKGRHLKLTVHKATPRNSWAQDGAPLGVWPALAWALPEAPPGDSHRAKGLRVAGAMGERVRGGVRSVPSGP